MHRSTLFALVSLSQAVLAGVLPRADTATTIDAALTDVSDPTSDQYGRFLSLDEAIELLPQDEQPSPALRSSVETRWRASFSGPVVKRTDAPVNCNVSMTPDCMRQLYHMGDAKASKSQQTIFGVIGFTNQSAQYKELDLFLNKYAPAAVGQSFTVVSVNGGENIQSENVPAGEANLDAQYGVALGINTDVRFYTVGGAYYGFKPDLDAPDQSEGIEPFLEMVTYIALLPDKDLPSVLSISYADNEQTLPRSYAVGVCNLFGLLALRGVSVIVGSGDVGPGMSCQSNDSKKKSKFLPSFPSSCPYVTSVGSTQGIGPEQASPFSSGGFSEYFDAPFWQKKYTQAYANKQGKKWIGYFNPTGRGYPDVSIQGGVDHPYFSHNQEQINGGTSFSAPEFAGMIAVINNKRAQKGKGPLGFLNPLLYLVAQDAFTDITVGRSEGCQGTSMTGLPSPVIPGAGWDADVGWDAVTGLGTPRFDRLLKIAGV